MEKIWPYRTPGVPDEMFIRGKIPMTKREVRVVSLAQARLLPTDLIYDIGAGTGSFTVEAALMAEEGRVFAIEKEAEGIELIKANLAKFRVNNVEVIQGSAPAALQGLPAPDKVFIGGSGGNLPDILQEVHNSLKQGGRVIANMIMLENLAVISQFFKEHNYNEVEIIQISVAKAEPVGGKSMLKGSNPVYILSASKNNKI